MISDRDLWQRARAAFDELVEMEPDQRDARLADLGRTDPALHGEVARLLNADPDAETALREYHFGSADPAPSTTAHDPLGIVGREVSHYRIDEFLAAGGMGVVYSAYDLALGRTVALKFPLPHQQVEPTVKERFSNEARSVATLDHPALCTIHEIGESEHGVYLAMPLYPGETLKDRLARDAELAPVAALEIISQVTAGLAAAHAAGIIHRDLKPGNIMLLPDGGVKVLDFGLAKMRDVDLTRSKTVLGTIGYVAPEQLRGERPDARVDLWAIGVILHEMLTGAPPFRGEHELSVLHAILHDDPPRPSEVNRALTPGYDQIIGALLQKDPADRYQSADALLTDVGALKQGAPVTVQTPFWSRTAGRRRVKRVSLPVAVVLTLAAAAVLWAVLGNRSPADAAAGPVLRWVDDVAEISTSAELAVALDPAHAGRHIRLRPGVYDITQPITVPDGMTLEGAGTMRYDTAGRPTGFTDDTRTTLRMSADVGGDMLTLGDGAMLTKVAVVDLPGRSGNIVAVVSRSAGDTVSATLTEVVIENPNPFTIGAGGPLGRGLYVVTLNPNMGEAPAPHNGAMLMVHMTRSIIASASGGGGLFAYNFAAESRIVIDLSESVIGGSNEANGGVSRPDAVHDSEVHIASQRNVYRNDWADPCVSPLLGWNLIGGSGAAIPIAAPAAMRNRLVVRSIDDRLQGFTTAIQATGSRRFFAEPLNAPPMDNAIDLSLAGTVITAPMCPAPGRIESSMGLATVRQRPPADLLLTGAWVNNDALYPGDRNLVRAELRGVTGSGRRTNDYAHAGSVSGAASPQLQGIGNRLEIVGDPASFGQLNTGVDPHPPAEFFTGAPTKP